MNIVANRPPFDARMSWRVPTGPPLPPPPGPLPGLPVQSPNQGQNQGQNQSQNQIPPPPQCQPPPPPPPPPSTMPYQQHHGHNAPLPPSRPPPPRPSPMPMPMHHPSAPAMPPMGPPSGQPSPRMSRVAAPGVSAAGSQPRSRSRPRSSSAAARVTRSVGAGAGAGNVSDDERYGHGHRHGHGHDSSHRHSRGHGSGRGHGHSHPHRPAPPPLPGHRHPHPHSHPHSHPHPHPHPHSQPYTPAHRHDSHFHGPRAPDVRGPDVYPSRRPPMAGGSPVNPSGAAAPASMHMPPWTRQRRASTVYRTTPGPSGPPLPPGPPPGSRRRSVVAPGPPGSGVMPGPGYYGQVPNMPARPPPGPVSPANVPSGHGPPRSPRNGPPSPIPPRARSASAPRPLSIATGVHSSAPSPGAVPASTSTVGVSPFSSFNQLNPRLDGVLNVLPPEVYDCILSQLELAHSAPDADGCTTCFMRDLHALSLTSRSWERAARVKLYTKIRIHGPDSPAQLKKYKCKRGSRLRLLRRTLRERKELGSIVLELRVPETDALLLSSNKQNPALQEYRDLVASVVMACPNLERLYGLCVPYSHEFDRLTHALATRRNLKEHAWIITENPDLTARSAKASDGLLDQGQVYQFLSYHTAWSNLETLVLHSFNSKGVLEHGLFLRMFNLLPALKNLSVSSFNTDEFTDRTLVFLPPLTSLRLENLPGVTEQGLARYCSRPDARGLQSLTLVELNITSLLIISKILASLRQLHNFCISQTSNAPTLEDDGGIIFQPILASQSLRRLHWDVTGPNVIAHANNMDSIPSVNTLNDSNTPNSHLARSILHAGFPSLEQLRAPNDVDPIGALQSVCRPARNGQIMQPSDRFVLPRGAAHAAMASKRSATLPVGNNLAFARIRAQTMIDAAYRDPDSGIKIVVTDHSALADMATDSEPEEDVSDIFGPATLQKKILHPPVSSGVKVHEFRFPLFLGRTGASMSGGGGHLSTPNFSLTPDLPGCDAEGGVVGWRQYAQASQTLTFIPPLMAAPVNGRTNSGSTTTSGSDDSMTTGSSPSTATSTSKFSLWSLGSHSNHGHGGSNSSSSAQQQQSPSSGNSITGNTTSSPLSINTFLPTVASANSPSSILSASPPPLGPPTPLLATLPEQPAWMRETCNGSWNQGHRGGKDWWMHRERERVTGAGGVRLETLFF